MTEEWIVRPAEEWRSEYGKVIVVQDDGTWYAELTDYDTGSGTSYVGHYEEVVTFVNSWFDNTAIFRKTDK